MSRRESCRRHRKLRELLADCTDCSSPPTQSLQMVRGKCRVHPDAVADHTTGETLLHLACRHNALGCVKVLLRRGANAVTVDVSGPARRDGRELSWSQTVDNKRSVSMMVALILLSQREGRSAHATALAAGSLTVSGYLDSKRSSIQTATVAPIPHQIHTSASKRAGARRPIHRDHLIVERLRGQPHRASPLSPAAANGARASKMAATASASARGLASPAL